MSYASGVQKTEEIGETPVEVGIAMIDVIKNRMASSEVGVLERPKELRRGQRIQLQGGPFVGLDALFIRETCGHRRAMVLLRTLVLHAQVVPGITQLLPDAAA